ncbi:hypothetical protein [Methylocaldum marinum]|uniref:hypothetical protein n=1 Tax=Methylocaldum marinum TaxID=1432792 RepID=UPI0011AE9CDA|nr:hypothetical protein [Methylocaldum marinum]
MALIRLISAVPALFGCVSFCPVSYALGADLPAFRAYLTECNPKHIRAHRFHDMEVLSRQFLPFLVHPVP